MQSTCAVARNKLPAQIQASGDVGLAAQGWEGAEVQSGRSCYPGRSQLLTRPCCSPVPKDSQGHFPAENQTKPVFPVLIQLCLYLSLLLKSKTCGSGVLGSRHLSRAPSQAGFA